MGVKEFYSGLIDDIKNCKNYKYISPDQFMQNDYPEYTNKPSILLFGCSFAYGAQLEYNQTFAYKLSLATKRRVYNKAICAAGIQHMFYMLKNDDCFGDDLSITPEYAIFLYIPDHISRLKKSFYADFNSKFYLNYELKNDKQLVVRKHIPVVFSRLALIKRFFMFMDSKYSFENDEYNNFALINELFLQSRAILEKRYPGIKFIILKYNYKYYKEEIPYDIPFLWTVLKDEGFIVIDTKDLIGKILDNNYTTEDKYHPNEAAWDLIVPKLVYKLNL